MITSHPENDQGQKNRVIREKIAIRSMLAEAEALESAAYGLRSRARDAQAAAATKARQNAARGVWRIVLAFMAKGISEPQAVRLAAMQSDLDPQMVQVHFDQAKVRRITLTKWLRDREILRRAHTCSNGELAAAFGLSKVQISRIIHAQLLKRNLRP
tara:strand:+ start:97 stop:567 length:471 start_codon:yes stop_codon:yes gene_type:complete